MAKPSLAMRAGLEVLEENVSLRQHGGEAPPCPALRARSRAEILAPIEPHEIRALTACYMIVVAGKATSGRSTFTTRAPASASRQLHQGCGHRLLEGDGEQAGEGEGS